MHKGIDWVLGASLALCACMPDVPQEAAPRFVELQFDPSGNPARTFEPTSLVMNSETGLIDLSSAGIDVPESCASARDMSEAQCEFYQYLERLDGFPTLIGGKTPSSRMLDLSSITRPRNLFIYDVKNEDTVSDVMVSFDADTKELLFDPPRGWDVGSTYVIGVRGYGQGVRDTRGAPAVASTIYTLLKRDTSLTCGATSAESIDLSCDAYALLEGDASFAKLPAAERHRAIAENLLQLEQLRLFYRGEDPSAPLDTWGILANVGRMPKQEVAIAWNFQTHSRSVIELDPQRGLVPSIVSGSEIRVNVKGSLNASTLSPFSLAKAEGTVFLFNVDKLQVDPLDPAALPPFSARLTNNQIIITPDDASNSFIDGDTYALLMTDELTDTRGRPLVASPVTVLLRSRGALTNSKGVSQVGGVDDDSAQALEEGRSQFAALLDDPLIRAGTTSAARPTGLVRERLVYLFGFTFTRR